MQVELPPSVKDKLRQMVSYSKAQAVLFGQWGFEKHHGRAQASALVSKIARERREEASAQVDSGLCARDGGAGRDAAGRQQEAVRLAAFEASGSSVCAA